jgi:alkylated DNA repair dioxygenase AlkB
MSNAGLPPSQSSLFDELPIVEPAGLVYHPEFLTHAEEIELIELIQTLALQQMRYKDYLARRRVISFGGRYDYDANRLEPGAALISALEPLREKVAKWLGVPDDEFTQVMVAEYSPGTPLGWHRDVPDFEDVVGVSLLNEAIMKFRPHAATRSRRARVIKLAIAPRSIYLLRGPVRWSWQHSVAPVAALRYSITFRTLRARC